MLANARVKVGGFSTSKLKDEMGFRTVELIRHFLISLKSMIAFSNTNGASVVVTSNST